MNPDAPEFKFTSRSPPKQSDSTADVSQKRRGDSKGDGKRKRERASSSGGRQQGNTSSGGGRRRDPGSRSNSGGTAQSRPNRSPSGSKKSHGQNRSHHAASGKGGKSGRGSSSAVDEIIKRVPERFRSPKNNDVFVSRNSEFAVLLAKAEKLFDNGHNDINVHGLGAAINRSICLAMRLQEKLPFSISISTTTSTVALVDDLIPTREILQKAHEEHTQVRNNSAIHINLAKVKR